MSTLTRFSAMAAFVMAAPLFTHAAILPVSSGLVLNFQADNINGANNAGMVDGQNVDTWVDVIQAGGNVNANNATSINVSTDVVDYLGPDSPSGPVTIAPPTYVADNGFGVPGVRFTRTSPTSITALGYNSSVNALLNNNAFTAFVVGDLSDPGPSRTLQFGRRQGSNQRIVGLANTGFRFNGGSKVYNENQIDGGAHVATYVMDLTQNYDAAQYRFDGAPGTFASGGGTGTLTLTDFNHGFAIGAGQDNSNRVIDALSGVVHAVVVYNRVLSEAEIMEVEQFLAKTYLVPEPSSASLLGLTIAALVSRRRSSKS